MSNIPQPIAVHNGTAFQNFRKGECGAYKNPVLYTAPNFAMPNVMIRRATDGTSATITLVDLDDNDVTTVTPAGQSISSLDTELENEVLVLGAGNWAGAASVISDKYYYFRIESGAFTYYTDEFFAMAGDSGFPENCGEDVWAKVTYTLNGSNIYAGTTTANPAAPVNAFPTGDKTFFLFWNANLSRPEWAQDETGEPDAHGQIVTDRVSLSKKWVLEGVPVSEGVSDALMISVLNKTATISFSDGVSMAGIKRIAPQIDWQQGGCLADVKYQFETAYYVKQGC